MAGLIPEKIAAGATLDMPVSVVAYPAPDWALTLILRGPAQIDLTSADDGEGHRFSASAALTAQWAPGNYWFSLRAIRGDDVYQIEEGSLTIRPDLAAIGPDYDGRTHAERALAAIEAVIEGRATTDQQSYTIAGRSLQRMPVADLLTFRAQYREEVRRQKQARKGQSLLGRRILARF